MSKRRLILCNGELPSPMAKGYEDRVVVELTTRGNNPTVNVKLEDVAKVFLQQLTPRQTDLLELASFVYAADTAVNRGGPKWDGESPEPWDRDFRYILPVRDLDFWTRPEVDSALRHALDFVSGDTHTFEFRPHSLPEIKEEFLDLAPMMEWPLTGVDRVAMFSGGLDSLAGAVEAAAAGERLVLVSHRSVNVINKRQRQLFDALQATYGTPMMRVPVWVNKRDSLSHESTQRTRSFLFCALGMVVAEAVSAGGVRFYENGVVSLNLPVADEVLRSRASRTTHPQTLERFAHFCRLFTGRDDFAVDNPYITATKLDIVNKIVMNGGAALIARSVSCATTRFRPATQQHCGVCSQCLDRRIAILAAGQAENDPAEDYEVDVFTGPRKKGPDQGIAVHYARHAHELAEMDEDTFVARFSPELSRATKGHPKRKAAVGMLTELHLRHGRIVREIIADQLARHRDLLAAGRLDKSSLLSLIINSEHMRPTWRRLVGRIVECLERSLPSAYRSRQPHDEPELQEQCDALLRANEIVLRREFPYLTWGVVMTKPDWTTADEDLLVELKYPRKRSDVRKIASAIAEDIQKYGAHFRRVLFIIYDPNRCITDEETFAEPILRSLDMDVSFIR